MSEALKQGAVVASKEMGEELNIKRKRGLIDDVMAADGYTLCTRKSATLGEMLEFSTNHAPNHERRGGEHHSQDFGSTTVLQLQLDRMVSVADISPRTGWRRLRSQN